MTKFKRPKKLKGTTFKVMTGCGELYVTINETEAGEMIEVFSTMGKAGGCASSQIEAIGRLISLGLRTGTDPGDIVKQLQGISCHSSVVEDTVQILSCSDGIAKAIGQYMTERKESK